MRLLRILIVDDEPQITLLMGEMLRTCGFDPVIAGNITEAWHHVQECAPDVIVCDAYMPDGNGCEFIQQLRAHAATESIPVLLMSGEPGVDQAGAAGFLLKPFAFRDLCDILRNVAGACQAA
jgi:CheY-like chemotaxis protein